MKIKGLIKAAIGQAYGLRRKYLLKDTFSVFVYHDVTNAPSPWSKTYGLNVRPDIFDFQIGFIKRHFNVISPDDLLGGRIPDRAALVTFDDGLKNVFIHAVPILERHGIPAIIFMNMAPVRGEIFWSGLITYLCEKRPDFVEYLGTQIEKPDNRALFLHCSKTIVESYLKKTGQDFRSEIRRFVGELASGKDLKDASQGRFLFYGNHLYNHHVALLMSDDELLDSFNTNAAALAKYPNSRSLFAFPFGQPGMCFSQRQVDLLLANGAEKVFSAYDSINADASSPYLHRMGFQEHHNSPSLMWYRIFHRR